MQDKDNPAPKAPTSVTKDNSAVIEDSAINATDGATALRDEAKQSGGNLTEDNLFGVGGNFDAGNDNAFTIENSDAETSREALREAGDTSRAALDDAFDFGTSTVQESLDAVRANSADAFDVVDETTYQAFQFGGEAFDLSEAALEEVGENSRSIIDALDDALGFATTSQQAANDLSRVTNETLAMKSSDADSAVSATLQKNVLIGTAIIAAAIVISRLPSK